LCGFTPGLTFGQQSKVEVRFLQLPLSCITSNDLPDTPSIERQVESRFVAVEYQRARKKLRKAVLEHYK